MFDAHPARSAESTVDPKELGWQVAENRDHSR